MREFVEPPAWKLEASCRQPDVDPSMFYAGKGENSKVAAAKRMCAGCPVREECLEYGLLYAGRHGIWGGLGDKERAAVRRERQAVPA